MTCFCFSWMLILILFSQASAEEKINLPLKTGLAPLSIHGRIFYSYSSRCRDIFYKTLPDPHNNRSITLWLYFLAKLEIFFSSRAFKTIVIIQQSHNLSWRKVEHHQSFLKKCEFYIPKIIPSFSQNFKPIFP